LAPANPEAGAEIPDMALVRMVGNTIMDDNAAACFKNKRREASLCLVMDEIY
jgi:hypothetical protein